MIRILINGILLVLVSRVICDEDDDYLGSTSDEDEINYQDTLYDTKDYPLNLDGSLRQRLALNGAIADPGNSFVCSPISALMPLGKLALGATGTCKSQLEEAIGVGSKSELKKSFTSLLRGLKSLSGVKLTVCSRIYVSKQYSLRTSYKNDAREIFKSTIKRINMKKPDKVARRINRWVRDKTKNLIKEIITPNSISPAASVILVNAVYFSGNWKHKFRDIQMRDFYTATSVRKVPMMTREGKYKYTKNDALDCQMIEIPYVGGHASFIIFLPNTRDGLPMLLYKLKLAPDLMQSAINKMREENVILSIPKFKTTTELDLKVSYEKLGLNQLLKTQKSGLNKIVSGDSHLYVSKAIQKAVIDVNENGTEAAAASVTMMVGSAGVHVQIQSIIFTADRPFIYMVKAKKEIIFNGIYV
ncbi:antichymotrypsin-2-like isoform X2 [Leguminivora glycinivorella]|uniref:antichymotrypsin-2-like isoform X2 n=1 Tax=Leguminivora glycinivorella TaxID=1035111 RepID=UPI00200F37B6|nr:antichymotrypsin-2-like isoform X2 [Leguminivora glycinivorella]